MSDLARNVTQDKIQHYPVVSFLPGAESPVGRLPCLAPPQIPTYACTDSLNGRRHAMQCNALDSGVKND